MRKNPTNLSLSDYVEGLVIPAIEQQVGVVSQNICIDIKNKAKISILENFENKL